MLASCSKVKSLSFSEEQHDALRFHLDRLGECNASLDYYQLYGLLFAVACAPEPIKVSEWFELVWLNDEPQFDQEEEARDFFQLVTEFADHIADQKKAAQFLPFGKKFSSGHQQALAQWSQGFLTAHYYLEEVWGLALDDIDDDALCDRVDATLNLVMTFADLINSRQMALEEGMELTDEHVPEAYSMLWEMLETYAGVAELWPDDGWRINAEQLFLALEPVGREEACPCGSGLPFGKCCLH
jgi:yecA family protein